jgi:hypothetical protein
MRIVAGISALVAGAFVLMAAPDAKTATIKGYVIDSACTFTKNLKKPISPDCAKACAKAGSPLVILGDDGAIYWPTTDAMPAASQNDKLVPFAGERVVASGKVYTHGGSKGLLIEKIEAEKK